MRRRLTPSDIRPRPVIRSLFTRGRHILTNGTGASVGEHNGYVYDTLKPPWRDTIQGTFVGQRGLDRLPNPYTLPGSNEPLFHVSLPLPGSNEPFISY